MQRTTLPLRCIRQSLDTHTRLWCPNIDPLFVKVLRQGLQWWKPSPSMTLHSRNICEVEPSFPSQLGRSHRAKDDYQSVNGFAEQSAENWEVAFLALLVPRQWAFWHRHISGNSIKYVDTVEYKLGWTPLTCQKGLGISASTGIEAA